MNRILIVGLYHEAKNWARKNNVPFNKVKFVTNLLQIRGYYNKPCYFVGNWQALPESREIRAYATTNKLKPAESLESLLESLSRETMTNKEIGKRFKKLVLNKGRKPEYHDEVVESLERKWPLLYKLIKEVEERS